VQQIINKNHELYSIVRDIMIVLFGLKEHVGSPRLLHRLKDR